jgi:hypothetical protein
MAVTQISKVKTRRGIKDDLSQLDGGEFGWCVDTHELYIGVGSDPEAVNPGSIVKVITQQDITSGNANVNIYYGANVQQNTDSISAGVTLANVTVNTIPVSFGIDEPAAVINYTIKRDSDFRAGNFFIAHNGTYVSTRDDYVESTNIGIILGAVMHGNTAVLVATTTAGNSADMKFTKSDFTW